MQIALSLPASQRGPAVNFLLTLQTLQQQGAESVPTWVAPVFQAAAQALLARPSLLELALSGARFAARADALWVSGEVSPKPLAQVLAVLAPTLGLKEPFGYVWDDPCYGSGAACIGPDGALQVVQTHSWLTETLEAARTGQRNGWVRLPSPCPPEPRTGRVKVSVILPLTPAQVGRAAAFLAEALDDHPGSPAVDWLRENHYLPLDGALTVEVVATGLRVGGWLPSPWQGIGVLQTLAWTLRDLEPFGFIWHTPEGIKPATGAVVISRDGFQHWESQGWLAQALTAARCPVSVAEATGLPPALSGRAQNSTPPQAPACVETVYPLATLTPNRVAIVVEGGLIQAVCADRPAEVQVLVVDYDREGVSPAALVRVPQVGGGTAEAVVTAWAPESPVLAMETLFDLIEPGRDESSLD